MYLALLLLVGFWTPTTSAGEMERTVVAPVASKTHPVVLTKIALHDTVVQSGRFVRSRVEPVDAVTPFRAGDDWIANLTLFLLNRTNRTIVHFSIRLGFPETGDGLVHPQYARTLNFGRMPDAANFDRNGVSVPVSSDVQPILFRPGETIAIHLGDYIPSIRGIVERALPLAATTRIAVHLGPFFFADGVQWHGSYSAPDAQNHKWIPLGPDFFPGDMDRNWPGRPGWENSGSSR